MITMNGCVTQNSRRVLLCKYRLMCSSSDMLGDGHYLICTPGSLKFVPRVIPVLNPSFFTRTIFSLMWTTEFKFIASHKQHENLLNYIAWMNFHPFL